MTFQQALKRYLDSLGWHLRRYPKAAKKRRVMKKWRNRFGSTLTEKMELIWVEGNPLYDLAAQMQSATAFKGATIPLPLAFKT